MSVGAERVLTQRELNRALLARQLLLDRSRLPIPRVLERIAGIQNQYAPSGYVRLWTCIEDFRREDLTRGLERGSVIQGTLMRETIHLVSRRDYAPLAAAIRVSGQEWWRRVNKIAPEVDMEAVASKVRTFLTGSTRTRTEIEEFVRVGGSPSASRLWGFAHWVDLVRVPPSGTWAKRRAHTFALAKEWVGALEVSEEAGIELLAKRYLGGFGPASKQSIASWSALPIARLSPVLERLPLRRFRDERGDELLDLARAPLPSPDAVAPVRFLPTFDATLLVHTRRTGILPEELRPRIFNTKTPQSVGTVLVDGAVAATWRYAAGRVETDALRRLSGTEREEVAAEAAALARLYA